MNIFYVNALNDFRSDENLNNVMSVLSKKIQIDRKQLIPMLSNYADWTSREYLYCDPIYRETMEGPEWIGSDNCNPIDGKNAGAKFDRREFVRVMNAKFVDYVLKLWTTSGKLPKINVSDGRPLTRSTTYIKQSASSDYPVTYGQPQRAIVDSELQKTALHLPISDASNGMSEKWQKSFKCHPTSFHTYRNRPANESSDGELVNCSGASLQSNPALLQSSNVNCKKSEDFTAGHISEQQLSEGRFPHRSGQNLSTRPGHFARGTLISNERTRIVPLDNSADRILESWKYPSAAHANAFRDDAIGDAGELGRGYMDGGGVGQDRNLRDATSKPPIDPIMSRRTDKGCGVEKFTAARESKDFYDAKPFVPMGKTLLGKPLDAQFDVGTSFKVKNRGAKVDFYQTANCENSPVVNIEFEPAYDGSQTPTPFSAMNDALNGNADGNNKLWVDGDGFVDQTDPAAMQRLFQRNIFRSVNNQRVASPYVFNADINEGFMNKPTSRNCKSAQNSAPLDNFAHWSNDAKFQFSILNGDRADAQIPWYEKALYKRNYERDVEENIGGFERDNIKYGYDMDSLRCRNK